jgi:bla regulator protein blaR1
MIATSMEWLADTVLWTGLLIALVLVVRRPVARNFGPQVAYALWALPFARLLLPPAVLPAVPAVAPLVMVPSGTGEGLAPVMLASALTPELTPAPAPFPWVALLVAVWAAGALAFLLMRVVTYHRMRRLLLADAREMGRSGRVRLVETPAVSSPVAFGVIDQVVALPLHFMDRADRQARELALAHELSHHQAHDLLANMAAQLLLALHWCNPVAWLGWRAMRQDQEAACDARVMAGRSRADRACYAALIVSYAAPRDSRLMTLATPMAGPILGEGTLLRRLRSLSRGDASRGRVLAGKLLVAAGALALPLTASITHAAPPQADPAGAASVPPPPPAAPVAPPAPSELQVIDPDAALSGVPGVPGVPGAPPLPPVPEQADGWAAFNQRMEAWGRRMGALAGREDVDQAAVERDAQAMAADMERQFAPGGALHAMIAQQTQAAEFAAAQAAAGIDEAALEASLAGNEARIEASVNRAVMHILRGTRASIAANTDMPAEQRAEALAELDGEIAELGAGT